MTHRTPLSLALAVALAPLPGLAAPAPAPEPVNAKRTLATIEVVGRLPAPETAEGSATTLDQSVLVSARADRERGPAQGAGRDRP